MSQKLTKSKTFLKNNKGSSKNKPKDVKNQPSRISKYRYSFYDTRGSKNIKKLNILVHWSYNTFLNR